MEGLTEEEVERRILEGQEAVLGGVEIHTKFVEVKGDPGICIECRAPAGPGGLPEGIMDINGRLAGLCQENILAMNDRARLRLLDIVKRDGGKDRMLYRFVVTSHIADDGSRMNRVSDVIDPDFLRIDAGIAERARLVRRKIEQLMEGDRGETGGGRETVSEDIFEIIPNTNYPIAIKDRTDKEAWMRLLEGQEFMLVEIQVIGFIEKYQSKDSLAFDFVAAISKKAVSSPWMKEKIRLLTNVCEDTVLGMNEPVTLRLYRSIRDTDARDLCLYRLSVWISMGDDGSPRWSIRDQIDPVFSREDSYVEMRAEEARRLAGMVMEEKAV